MPKRIKVPDNSAPVPQTKAEAEALAGQIVAIQLEREKKIAQRDAKIEAVSAAYNSAIAEAEVKITEQMAALKAWASANKAEFGPDKSISLAGHRVGWRLGNWKAGTLPRFTWPKVILAIKEAGRAWSDVLIRTKEEVDKEAAIARRQEPDYLAKVGIRITQDETFYLSPGRDGQEGPVITA